MKKFALLLLCFVFSNPAYSKENADTSASANKVFAASEKEVFDNALQDVLAHETKKSEARAKKMVKLSKNKQSSDNKTPPVFIGENIVYAAEYEDNLLDLAHELGIGYIELVAANQDIDPILPGKGAKIIVPWKTILPDAPREGVVINLAEMRMFDYTSDPLNPRTYPLGIGREGLHTPLGTTTIVRKAEGPVWRPTPRMRAEDPKLPAAVGPGPDNPLGTHALYLGWSQYLIHGTQKPLGIGRRSSSGCMRMYPKDIIEFFGNIPTGTKIHAVSQPVKMAWDNDMLYLEAHAEDDLADVLEGIGDKISVYRVPSGLFEKIKAVAGVNFEYIDWDRVKHEVKYRTGVPVPVLKKQANTFVATEEFLKTDPDIVVVKEEDKDVEVKEEKEVSKPRKLSAFQVNS